jgi:hypothetical protein
MVSTVVAVVGVVGGSTTATSSVFLCRNGILGKAQVGTCCVARCTAFHRLFVNGVAVNADTYFDNMNDEIKSEMTTA